MLLAREQAQGSRAPRKARSYAPTGRNKEKEALLRQAGISGLSDGRHVTSDRVIRPQVSGLCPLHVVVLPQSCQASRGRF